MSSGSTSGALYQLEDVVLEREGRQLLGPFSLEIRDHAVTAILGPAGTGKSTLLRVLAGGPSGPEVATRGYIRYRECELGTRLWPPGDVVHAGPQSRPVLPHTRGAGSASARIRRALASGASTVLLDEPTRGCAEQEIAELGSSIRAHTASGAVVLVSHDIGFVRAVADDVCFFVAGRLEQTCTARTFFETPPSPLAARFASDGNCWPAPPPPPLPAHFRWLIPGRLGGMGRPGLLEDTNQELEAIAYAGIKLLVTLTEEPIATGPLSSVGILGRHFPVRDMGVPSVARAARLCREIERSMGEGRPVALHCKAGLGRTGTLLAACLVWMGSDPESAIAEVRRVHTSYIQSPQQERFVHDFAASL